MFGVRGEAIVGKGLVEIILWVIFFIAVSVVIAISLKNLFG